MNPLIGRTCVFNWAGAKPARGVICAVEFAYVKITHRSGSMMTQQATDAWQLLILMANGTMISLTHSDVVIE